MIYQESPFVNGEGGGGEGGGGRKKAAATPYSLVFNLLKKGISFMN
jgi:hypothetical protein